jgi:hypothetical protein
VLAGVRSFPSRQRGQAKLSIQRHPTLSGAKTGFPVLPRPPSADGHFPSEVGAGEIDQERTFGPPPNAAAAWENVNHHGPDGLGSDQVAVGDCSRGKGGATRLGKIGLISENGFMSREQVIVTLRPYEPELKQAGVGPADF